MSKRKRRAFTKEFKAETVRLVRDIKHSRPSPLPDVSPGALAPHEVRCGASNVNAPREESECHSCVLALGRYSLSVAHRVAD